MGWSQAHARSMIEKAKDQGVIKEITFGGKPALQKNNQSVIFRDRLSSTSTQTTQSVIFRDRLSSTSTQTTQSVIFRDRLSSTSTQTTGTNIYSEFMQFKKLTSSEIANLHASTDSKTIGMDTNDSKALLIRCIQDHIASLEKQLDEKQIIIEENTKIIANLISIHIKGNGKHRGLHDNQLLQSQSLKQVHDMEATQETKDITAEQKSQQSTMNKKGNKKPNQQKGYDAPQKNQAPDGTQSLTMNDKESMEARKTVNNEKNSEISKGDIKRLHVKRLDLPYNIQILPIEINLRKAKWLLFPSYRPPNCNEKYF